METSEVDAVDVGDAVPVPGVNEVDGIGMLVEPGIVVPVVPAT